MTLNRLDPQPIAFTMATLKTRAAKAALLAIVLHAVALATAPALAAQNGALSAQKAAPIRYKDDVFTAVTRTADVPYGSSKTYTGATETLLLDLYQPQGDTAKVRPLMIWVHGGGFSGGGKNDADMSALCQVFAKKGYVTASIAYRLQPEAGLNTSDAMTLETFRAVQDAKAAVRFLRARRADYRIDDTRILMGGTSAGGVVSLLYAYLDPDELPTLIDTSAMGGLEGSGGTPGVSSAINGIINCWGGVGDSTWLANGKLPAISFHGTVDPTVPYDKGYSLGNPSLTTFGSACVHRVLTRAGARSVLKPFPGMGHGVPGGDPRADTLVTMTRDFAFDVLFGATTGIAGSAGSAEGTGKGSHARTGSQHSLLRLFPKDRWGFRVDGKAFQDP